MSAEEEFVIDTLVLLGASGDLAGRFLMPALATLEAAGRLPGTFGVVGGATADRDDEAFRREAAEHLERHASDVPASARAALLERLRYVRVDVTDEESVAGVLAAAGDRPLVAYLALPPVLFPATVTALGSAGLPRGSRIALEKPFGEDLAGARDLNALLDRVTGEAGEAAVFRVDHVLGMATVANLVGMRAANPWLETLWNSASVAEVEVLWEETLALEGRAGYYDGAGALDDVVQNHVLQVLSLVAMDLPAEPGERALRDAKVAALRSVRRLAPDDIANRTRRARYSAGRLADSGGADGGQVPDYAEEEGVDPARGTETYAELVLELDTPRWSGTRFVLRAGKALAVRRKGVFLHFRHGGPAGSPAPEPGSLWIGVDGPDDVVLTLAGRAGTDEDTGWRQIALVGRPPESELPPYARVLLDVLGGGSALSVRADEAEEQWRIVGPIAESWAAGSPRLGEYPAGTAGPERLARSAPSATT
jgi:glucose-6-phosphate 1-dehydrogenase